MQRVKLLACAGALLLGFSQLVTAQGNRDAQDQRVDHAPVLISTDVLLDGTTTGPGGRDGVRVLPWSMVSVHSVGDEQELRLSCPTTTLNSAPELDGKAGATICSPALRRHVATLASKSSD